MERRAGPRVETQLRAHVKLPNGRWLASETIRNISLGGAYIATSEPVEPGSELQIEFELPGAVIRCAGVVVWSRAEDIPGQQRLDPGIGVRLTRLGAKEVGIDGPLELNEMRELAAYIEGSLAKKGTHRSK